MASALGSPTVPSSQGWWQASPKSSAQDLRKVAASSEKMPSARTNKSSGFKLLASAMGFKSKKPQPTLTIQQPPATLPRRAHTSHGIVTAPLLSPSKSSSSTRTGIDSLGPETPLDSPKRASHHSLFTLSDADPFAVRSAASAPPTPSQSSLYSINSDNAMPEFAPIKVVDPYANDRLSYSSTSSNSVSHSNGYLSPSDHGSKLLVSKKSAGNLRPPEQSMNPPALSRTRSKTHTLVRSTSSTTLTEKNRFSQPNAPLPPRPPMRARGMTHSGPSPSRDIYPVQLVESAAVTAVQNARVLVRKPSVSRIGMPKSAPPAQELPPTPPLPLSPPSKERPFENNKHASSSGSILSSSSSLSPFASPISADHITGQNYLSSSPYNPSSPDLTTPSKVSQGSLWSTPRTIKKALSHQSLRRNHSSISSTEPPPPLPDTITVQPLHKQPSLHDTVFPSPPSTIPTLRHTSSFGSQPSSPPKESPMIQEPKRTSSNGLGPFSTPGRRRLFSVSSHRSQTLDDDSRSVTSVRSDSNQTVGSFSFRSLGVPLSPTSNHSSWEDARPQSILSTGSAAQQEYTPQHILSPAEMEKLAAGLGEFGDKSATSSRRSSAQGSSSPGESSPVEHLTTPITRKLSSSTVSLQTTRRQPLHTNGPSLPPPPRQALKQSMSQNSLASLPRAPSPLGFASLPPPPRRRPRTRPAYPAASSDVSTDSDSIGFVPLPPAPRRIMRAKISVEKALHRRSIARKPSFLDINDDTDEDDSDGLQDGSMHGSFLDLARESFDSVRTEEPETY